MDSQQNRRHSVPKRQHWLPQFYLRHFAVPDADRVWVTPRSDRKPYLGSIKDVACQSYLYSPESEDGSRGFAIEERLSKLESTLALLWDHLTSGYYPFAADASKKGLSLFIANLLLRHPRRIAEIEDVHNQMVAFLDKCPKNERGAPNIESIIHKGREIPFDTSGWDEFKNATERDHHRFFADVVNEDTGSLARILVQKPWRMLISDAPVYVTADQPIIMWNSDRQHFGIRTPGTTIFFPISPTRVLVIDDRIKRDGMYRPDVWHNGFRTNLIVWLHTTDFMISSRHPDEVMARIKGVWDYEAELYDLKEHRRRREQSR